MNTLLKKTTEKFVDDVPVFCDDNYWGKSKESLLLDAIKTIDSEGWLSFNNKFYKKFDYSLDESLADWHFNIPIDKDFIALDIGAGLGRSSIPLSRFVKKVVSVDNSVFVSSSQIRRMPKSKNTKAPKETLNPKSKASPMPGKATWPRASPTKAIFLVIIKEPR